MRIRIEAGTRRRWQGALADRLAAAGHTVAWARASAGGGESGSVALLLTVEALLYGLTGPRAGDVLPPARPTDLGPPEADLVIDLTGRSGASGALRPLFDGSPDVDALHAALLAGRTPSLTVALGERIVRAGLPGIETPRVFTLALEGVLARLVDLFVGAVAAIVAGSPGMAGLASAPWATSPVAVPCFLAASFARKILDRLVRRGETWRVGWRSLGGVPALDEAGAWPAEGYRWLGNPPGAFLADPFVVEHEGRTHILCEEFPFGTERGVISALTLDADGTASAPRIVLERPYHLSYPFMFRHAGAIWMIPETSANRTIELYRARRFPDDWSLESVLVRDVVASDATLVQVGAVWWMFATLAGGGSAWDALALWQAPDPRGPWRPHPGNPVLVDASAARPAGAMRQTGGGVLRVAQDCRTRYGAGLALCRVDRLDDDGFAQTVMARLAPPPAWSALGTHTLNRSERIEVVDAVFATTRAGEAGPERR